MQHSEAAVIDAQQSVDDAKRQYEADTAALQVAKDKLRCAQAGVAYWQGNASPARYHAPDGSSPVHHSPSPLVPRESPSAISTQIDVDAMASFLF